MMVSSKTPAAPPSEIPSTVRSGDRHLLIAAGITLGMGQAGFFDGIVFHQLLQWHHMFSAIAPETTVAGLELNTLGDGLFHLFDWLITLVGIALLWRAAKSGSPLSTHIFIGSLIFGIGAFNFLEGLIDHQLLGIHHVHAGDYALVYDLVFLIVNGAIATVGWNVMMRAIQRS